MPKYRKKCSPSLKYMTGTANSTGMIYAININEALKVCVQPFAKFPVENIR